MIRRERETRDIPVAKKKIRETNRGPNPDRTMGEAVDAFPSKAADVG